MDHWSEVLFELFIQEAVRAQGLYGENVRCRNDYVSAGLPPTACIERERERNGARSLLSDHSCFRGIPGSTVSSFKLDWYDQLLLATPVFAG